MKVFLPFALSLSTSALRAARAVHGQSPLPVKAKPPFLFLFFFSATDEAAIQARKAGTTGKNVRESKSPPKTTQASQSIRAEALFANEEERERRI